MIKNIEAKIKNEERTELILEVESFIQNNQQASAQEVVELLRSIDERKRKGI